MSEINPYASPLSIEASCSVPGMLLDHMKLLGIALIWFFLWPGTIEYLFTARYRRINRARSKKVYPSPALDLLIGMVSFIAHLGWWMTITSVVTVAVMVYS